MSDVRFDINQALKAARDPYRTPLASEREKTFRAWLEQNKIPFDPDQEHPDYDMRGFYLDTLSGTGKRAANMHFPDKYKTPYHETFSNESKYATPDAPHWVESDAEWTLVSPDGRVLKRESK